MRLLTAAAVGVLTGIAAAILWIAVRFVLPLAYPSFLAIQSGSGGAGAVIGLESILLAASLGFLGGFVGMLWRR